MSIWTDPDASGPIGRGDTEVEAWARAYGYLAARGMITHAPLRFNR
jgi:hypothetical protein